MTFLGRDGRRPFGSSRQRHPLREMAMNQLSGGKATNSLKAATATTVSTARAMTSGLRLRSDIADLRCGADFFDYIRLAGRRIPLRQRNA